MSIAAIDASSTQASEALRGALFKAQQPVLSQIIMSIGKRKYNSTQAQYFIDTSPRIHKPKGCDIGAWGLFNKIPYTICVDYIMR